MRLYPIVETSERLKATRSRKAKTQAVADLLGQCAVVDVPTVVAWMSGTLLQGRIGISVGRAHAFADGVEPASEPTLTLSDIDAAFEALQNATGPGSVEERKTIVRQLMLRSVVAEQEFLVGLLAGELRQGALQGIVIEGIAKAAEVPSALVRRATMLSGELPRVAALAFDGGEAALKDVGLQLFVPVQPMLAQTADTVEDALAKKSPLAFEEKLDGMRLQLHRDGDRVEIYSRSLRTITRSLPEVVRYARGLSADKLILDGEIMRFAAGRRPMGMGAAMERFGRSTEAPEVEEGAFPGVTPVFFDCLMADGQSLIDETTDARWSVLERVVDETHRVQRLVTGDTGEAAAFVQSVLQTGHEGVVAKSPTSPYTAGGRGAHWFKIKPAHTLDVVVLGAEWGNGRRKGLLSNLHLGLFDPEAGRYVMLGKTFKGMTDDMLKWQTERLLELETHRDETTVFVRPEVVVEVAFDELFKSRRYDSKLAFRFARVLRYRPDKTAEHADSLETARAIKRGEILPKVGAAKRTAKPKLSDDSGPTKVIVSNADRVIYPDAGITKGDIVEHYRRVGERMWPHVRARPLTLVRYPKGIQAKGFYQKNVAKHYPEALIGRIALPRQGGKTVHPEALAVEALAYLANQGTVEFHIPTGSPEFGFNPDRLVFDFDPPEGEVAAARDAAWACKALLDELGVDSLPMATGSKGFHVYVRLVPGVSMTRTTHKIGALLVHRHPDLLTHEVLKEARRGKVLVDWMRNAGRSTVIAPWSLRARPGGPMATPLSWDELEGAQPDQFRLGQDDTRSDPIWSLTECEPETLVARIDEMFEAAGIELEYIDRFGRKMR